MQNLFKSILASAVLTLIGANLLLAGALSPEDPNHPSAAKVPIPQTTCPVMGGTIGPIDKALYVDVKGKRIYICCAACEDAIRADPDTYIKKIEKRGETVTDTPSPAENASPPNKKARD